MPAYYPIFLDVRNRRCVVFGGGVIGAEKVVRLLEYGARVVVISTEIDETLKTDVEQSRITWVQRNYREGDLEGAFIAIVADTRNAELNQSVSEEAMERNIPLNVVDVTNLCTWIAPSITKRGDVIVATSTGGASPALARWFRERLSGSARDKIRYELMEYADLAPLLSRARNKLVRKGLKVSADHWQACLVDDLVELVQAGNIRKAEEMLYNMLQVGLDCNCSSGCKMWEERCKLLIDS